MDTLGGFWQFSSGIYVYCKFLAAADAKVEPFDTLSKCEHTTM